jgi:DNA-binding MarR family transcriptional regulator
MLMEKLKLPHLDERPSYQLWLAGNAWQRVLRRSLEPLGLTHVQFIVLGAVQRLGQEKELVSQADVCRLAAIDQNMASAVIRFLEKKGLLRRVRQSADRRAFHLLVTEAGANVIQTGADAIGPARDAFFGRLGDEQKELARMLRVLAEADGPTTS